MGGFALGGPTSTISNWRIAGWSMRVVRARVLAPSQGPGTVDWEGDWFPPSVWRLRTTKPTGWRLKTSLGLAFLAVTSFGVFLWAVYKNFSIGIHASRHGDKRCRRPNCLGLVIGVIRCTRGRYDRPSPALEPSRPPAVGDR